jgi:hypothetical protein
MGYGAPVHELLERLRGGDRRSKRPSERAAAAAIADPPLIAVLLDGMRCDDEVVRMRAADAAEQAARERPELIAPHADALIEIAAGARQAEVRRHAAQMLARSELSDDRAAQATRVLHRYLSDDDGENVQAWALSAIVAIANDHPALREHARELVHDRLESDSPAVRARAEMLVGQADSWPS